VIAFEGDGKLIEYVGGYEDWVRVKKYQAGVAANKTPSPLQGEGGGGGRSGGSKAAPSPQPSALKSEGVKSKLSFKEQRELEELPKRIEALEREQGDIAAHLADGTIYRTDAKRAKQLQTRNEEIESEVLATMARWEELEGKGGKAG